MSKITFPDCGNSASKLASITIVTENKPIAVEISANEAVLGSLLLPYAIKDLHFYLFPDAFFGGGVPVGRGGGGVAPLPILAGFAGFEGAGDGCLWLILTTSF